MRCQNVIIFSSGKNKRVAHEIARGLDGEVGKEGSAINTFERIRSAG